MLKQLQEVGWRVLVVWECAVRGRGRWGQDEVLDSCEMLARDPDARIAEFTGAWRDAPTPAVSLIGDRGEAGDSGKRVG